jgi:hypothetical protein
LKPTFAAAVRKGVPGHSFLKRRNSYDRGKIRQLVCMGRSGKTTPYPHDSHESVMWHIIEEKLRKVKDVHQPVFTDI